MTNPWVLLGFVVSAAMIAGTPFLWRNRGAVFGLRWFAVALLPGALALTGLLTLFGRVGNAVANFFTGSVFSPRVWVGYAALGVAVLVWFIAGAVRARSGGSRANARPSAPQVGSAAVAPTAGSVGRAARPSAVAPGGGPSAAAPDDDFAEIEAILKRRGI